MNVNPFARTTLFLGMDWMPYTVGTARATFMHLLKGKAVGLDENNSPVIHFEQLRSGRSKMESVVDQPSIRSAHQEWHLPTVIVANRRMFFNSKKKGPDGFPPVREVYDYFDGICQYCYKHVKWREVIRSQQASRDHIIPRRGGHHGPDSRANAILMHAQCNSNLGSNYPKKDINGDPITEGMRPKPVHFMISSEIKVRPEWLRVAPWLDEKPVELDLTS